MKNISITASRWKAKQLAVRILYFTNCPEQDRKKVAAFSIVRHGVMHYDESRPCPLASRAYLSKLLDRVRKLEIRVQTHCCFTAHQRSYMDFALLVVLRSMIKLQENKRKEEYVSDQNAIIDVNKRLERIRGLLIYLPAAAPAFFLENGGHQREVLGDQRQ
ncbi:MAG: hypothetical protein ACRBFS_10495 [Aureispira sp.]